MSVRWGEPRPAVLEHDGRAVTVVLVAVLIALLTLLAVAL